jgi:DNA-binding GntR family transcriptional regulator
MFCQNSCILYTMLTPKPQLEAKNKSFARPTLVRHEVYDHLKLEILTGKLGSGSRLAEIALAKRLGVSRTPVREAVQRLAQDGLVEIEANKGAKVRAVNALEVEHVYAVREILDGLAAREAASHATNDDIRAMKNALEKLETCPANDFNAQIHADLEFHNAIAQASQNPTLVVVLRGLAESIIRVKLLTAKYMQDAITRSSHYQILAAIENRNAELSEQTARAHVRDFGLLTVENLKAALKTKRDQWDID